MSIYIQRQKKLQVQMQKYGMNGFLVTHNVDLFYFTGSMQTGYLFIPMEGEALYWVRRSIQRAREESYFAVEPLGSLKTLCERLSAHFPQLFTSSIDKVVIATEFDVLPVQHFQRLEGAFPGVKWVDGSMVVRELRMIKSADELASIRQAAKVIDIALEAAISHVHAGMQEVELMAFIEQQIRLQGHLGLMRMRGYNSELITGMVAAGAAAAVPTYFDGPAGGLGLSPASPQSSSRNTIERNEPLLVDLGCCVDGYVIDQTRTLVIGDLPEDLQRAYDISEEVLRSAETRLKPGTVSEHLYYYALDQVKAAGLSEHFMGFGEDQVKFLGHGIGLEIDELPVLAKGFKYPLETGMVIAIEPKFTFPGRGVVGIENSYAITDTGFERLTVSREGLIRI